MKSEEFRVTSFEFRFRSFRLVRPAFPHPYPTTHQPTAQRPRHSDIDFSVGKIVVSAPLNNNFSNKFNQSLIHVYYLYREIEIQRLYQTAIKFAAAKHGDQDQKIPGTDLPYVVHVSNVAMEILLAAAESENFNLAFAIQVALLHDTLEDTDTDLKELETKFGLEIALAVAALTKNNVLPKEAQMQDSLTRIKKLANEVWAVKLADRITNLQPPPSHWNKEKRIKYKKEAQVILDELKGGNEYLAKRLEAKIEKYEIYITHH